MAQAVIPVDPPQGLTLAALAREVAALREEVAVLRANQPEDKLSMVVMSGSLDRLLAAFIIATGATAMFEKVHVFFTFWAIPVLRDPQKKAPTKDVMSAMFGAMLPKGEPDLKLSQMNMLGAGTSMLKGLMKKKNVLSLSDLMQKAAENGVKVTVCEMSMNLMGFSPEEMIDYPDLNVAGVARFLSEAGTSKATLFI